VNPLERFNAHFKLAGTVFLDACPVCESTEIAEIWRLPQSRLKETVYLNVPGSPMNGTYLNYLPTLESPQQLFKFDICGQCESIFLNPKHDDQEIYARDASKVESFRKKGPDEFKGAAQTFLRVMPTDTKVVVDAACGAGQSLHLMKAQRPDLKVTGLELSVPAVTFMNDELGIEAHAVDLDRDDLKPFVAPGSVDFIIFQEAYEHVRSPITTMHKLVEMLRPGGRIHFTAQYWGDNPLQIRVGEPIYINQCGLDYTLDQLGVKMVELKKDIKIRATVEKPL
jgi:Methyltransferase domain